MQVFHVISDDSEYFFSYSFKTLPYDSSGVFHILEHTDLITDSRLIHRRAQRSQIVMIADTLEKKLLSIQEKALVRNQLDRTNTKSRAIGIA